MLDTFKQLLANEFEGSLCMLHHCVDRCPDAAWDLPVAKRKFCQAAFHVLFFTDLYLQPDESADALKRRSFHLAHRDDFRDYEELTDRPQVEWYARAFVLDYLREVRVKARETVAAESAQVLAGPSGFSWRKCSRAELHVYNIRHVQHHTAQLSLRLRLDHGIDIPWVGHAWKE
jgi:hypothetical protein